MPPEEHIAREERFARLRRLKQFLRYMPRRAVFHKYPLIGRFADAARKRAYLWSFKTANLRPSFYAGSILSLLPVALFRFVPPPVTLTMLFDPEHALDDRIAMEQFVV